MSRHSGQRTQMIATPAVVGIVILCVGLVILCVPRLPEDSSPLPKHVAVILIVYCVLWFLFYCIFKYPFCQYIERITKTLDRLFRLIVFLLIPNLKKIHGFFFRNTEITHSELHSFSVLEVTWRNHANRMVRLSESVAKSMIFINSHKTFAILYSCTMLSAFFLHILWNILQW